MARSWYSLQWYYAEVSHDGLHKYQTVRARSPYEANRKASALYAQWDAQWRKQCERENRLRNDADSVAYAAGATEYAEKVQKGLDEILLSHLGPAVFDIDEAKDHSIFLRPAPQAPNMLVPPSEPLPSDAKYNPSLSFFTKISKKKREAAYNENRLTYESDHAAWELERSRIEHVNSDVSAGYNQAVKDWEADRDSFYAQQAAYNADLDATFVNFKAGESADIEKYISLFLDHIDIPLDYDKSYDVEYEPSSKRLIVEMMLPVVDDIPKLKSVQYIKTRHEIKENEYSDSYLQKKYDSVVYQIVLLVFHSVFSITSPYSLIDAISINGRINTVDKATGQTIEPCILSVASSRSDFQSLNLSAVDPKTWFKRAKGVSAASLASTTPVAPIISISRDDSRFVPGYGVAETLDNQTNLAAIDWLDFENLIRELFEKEFSSNGGEVKITQASRDGGVDAVAFDPDPIRGGKIVIQAKRYTNVVGVSAVRDLYGTVLNEGATKGILVTTSNYGNDAYAFAKDKPLTLLNGGNLLSLLDKHGYHAKINLKEAKEALRQ